ncbi:MAG: hypothetical protein J7J51_04770 [Candidatus Omnitrophica bacterium]|nr:hypothetical protein [Candidatus Omnitrophota bacterium]
MRKLFLLSTLYLLLATFFCMGCTSQENKAQFYPIKGVCYNPVPIGQGYDYNFWQDADELAEIDGKLMSEMGVNMVRFYQPGNDVSQTKRLIHQLYTRYKIRSAVGHQLGFWDRYLNYADPRFQKRIEDEVLEMVRSLKDEPGISLWILGNENNRSFEDNGLRKWSSPELDKIESSYKRSEKKAEIYYRFVNRLAKKIHQIDNRPVALGNADLTFLDIAKDIIPDIDILAITVYRGDSFGNFFNQVKKIEKPFFFSEFGCDAYNALLKKEDKENQALFLKNQWKEIKENFGPEGCLGGFVFEWNDEWWKYAQWDRQGYGVHNPEATWTNGGYYFDAPAGKNINEEWWGIVALEKQEGGLDKRVPRKVYYELQKMWE